MPEGEGVGRAVWMQEQVGDGFGGLPDNRQVVAEFRKRHADAAAVGRDVMRRSHLYCQEVLLPRGADEIGGKADASVPEAAQSISLFAHVKIRDRLFTHMLRLPEVRLQVTEPFTWLEGEAGVDNAGERVRRLRGEVLWLTRGAADQEQQQEGREYSVHHVAPFLIGLSLCTLASRVSKPCVTLKVLRTSFENSWGSTTQGGSPVAG